MKKLLLIVASITVVFALSACDNNKPTEQNSEKLISNNTNSNSEASEKTKENAKEKEDEVKGIKYNEGEAKYQIQLAMQKLIEEAYGDAVYDTYTNVDKVYSAEEEEEIDVLKEYNLGPDEVAFEVSFSLNPAEGADILQLTATDGEYDKESGRVVNKHGLGILRPSGDSYVITNFGTGW